MRWVAPSEKDTANQTLEKRPWAAADQFRAKSGLNAGQYSTLVLGLNLSMTSGFHRSLKKQDLGKMEWLERTPARHPFSEVR